MKKLWFSSIFFTLVLSTCSYAEYCPLSGDISTCGDVTLSEVVSCINQWASGLASLSDVVSLINAWAGPHDTPSNNPVVELFVMSHCPYGLQIEKGFIPVLDALNDSINFSVHFCSYSMHGKKELDEQLLQHCIQKERTDKYIPYLRCFLEEGNTSGCLNRTGQNISSLAGCINSTDGEYNVSAYYGNVSTWLYRRYPRFGVDSSLDEKYDISASPTLVVDSKNAETGRDPKSILATLCAAYKVKPEGCYANLSDAIPSPGFGYDGTGEDGGSC